MVLTKNEIGKLVKDARKIKSNNMGTRYTQEMLASEIGISRSYLGDIESGRKYPTFLVLNSIAETCEVPLDFFKTFTPEAQKTIKNISSAIKKQDRLKEIKRKINEIQDAIVDVPVIGFVPAGGPVIVEENKEGVMMLPYGMLKGTNDFCLRVRGDSMIDVGINDKDMVLVHPQPVAENGQTVIARVDGEVTCKRFYQVDGKCTLEPANHNYKPIDCNEIEIVGIVTKIIKDVF